MNDALSLIGGAGNLGTLFLNLTANSASLVQNMDAAERKILTSSAAMGNAVVKLGAVVTTALTGMAVVALREFSKFEDSFAGVRKTVDATEVEFSRLADTFRRMARETPVNVNELNRIAEAAGQLGVRKNEIVGFTKVMADMGITTNMTSDEAATAMARFANVLEVPKTQMDRLGATIVALGNDGASTEKEIMDMAQRIAGAGKSAGLSANEVLALANALSSVGIEAEAGGTSMSTVLTEMFQAVNEGGEKLQMFAEVTRQTTAQFTQQFSTDAAGAALKFIEGLRKMQDEGKNVFNVFEALNLDGVRMKAMLLNASAAGDLFARSLSLGKQAWLDNTALSEEAQKRYATFSSQMQITVNILRDFAITAGEALAPAILQMNGLLQAALKDTTGFATAMQKLSIDVLPAIVAGVGAIGDAWLGLRLVIKSGEVLFTSSASVVLNITRTIARGIEFVWEGAINGIISGINKFVRWANEQLPQMARKIPEIDFKLDIPREKLDTFVQAVDETWADSVQEWKDLVKAQGSFSESVIAGYERIQTASKTTAKAVVQDAKAQADALQTIQKKTMDPTMLARNQAENTLKGMDLPGMTTHVDKNGKKTTRYRPGLGIPGMDDPNTMRALEIQNELKMSNEKLKVLKDINDKELQLSDEMNAKKIALLEAYNERVRALTLAQAQIAFANTSQMFGDLAMIAEQWGGKTSGMYQAMFAASKAFAIAEAIVKIQQGIANAASLPFPANLGAMASVASATASIVSSISAVTLNLQARERGGPVARGRAYIVGEKGPELFFPSEQGEIIPNNRLRGMGGAGGEGGATKVIVNNYTDAKPEVHERNEGGERVLEIVVRRAKEEIASEIRDGRGTVSKAMERTYNLGRGRAA